MTGPVQRRPLWREPLLAFVVLGAVVFGIDRALPRDEPAARQVRLDRETHSRLLDELHAALGRAPTPTEIAAAEQRWVSTEVLVREGLALGLERDDPIVRQRIVDKMQLALDDFRPSEPRPGQLEDYFAANRARFAEPGAADFVHVWLSEAESADEILARLEAGEDPAALGRPFPDGSRFRRRPRARVAQSFGEGFAAELFSTPSTGRWIVRRSDHGTHVVKTLALRPGREPRLAGIRERVLEDWHRSRRREHVRARVDALVDGWELVIER
ncbi:peptidyl-prolyl cis-trans isomerase [Enhygromyxa salina]|uniref:PpiC domain-containing protein n=1 Tax=Enhygromyxa salina TaxID=215803 RepID=A0A2S9YK99_9BACT|nr:peptidylprolyl isomerase [Enhygromyxa salina]PRQ05535.1 hypothetical protein ENSA7_45810 [Enhygromyxa salina]